MVVVIVMVVHVIDYHGDSDSGRVQNNVIIVKSSGSHPAILVFRKNVSKQGRLCHCVSFPLVVV